ncbi:MAG: hypothetical protein JNL01_07045 [Bdellovibrionales bacterium]|nr:hypothetical protein [Bdellovibrionales bacterium]
MATKKDPMTRILLVLTAFLVSQIVWADPFPSTPWELLSESDGIKTYRKEVPGSSIVAFKGEGDIDATIAEICGVVDDVAREKEWMSDLKVSYIVEKKSENQRVEYNESFVPWPFQNRDFVIDAKASFEKKPAPFFRVVMQSIEHSAIPKKSGIVRGQLHDSVFEVRSIDGGKRSHLTVEIFADPMGNIPNWVVNLVQKSWPKDTIEGIRKQIKKGGITPHPKMVEWLKSS